MSVLGTIEIQMLADLARLKKDMDQAKDMVGSATREMQRYADFAKAALGGIAAGLTIGAFKSMFQEAVDAADQLRKLSVQTGVTVENLSAFTELGRTSGAGIDQITGAMGKLAKTMASGSEEAKRALAAVGLNMAQFQRLGADEQLQQLAVAMAKFDDGNGKAAVSMALMGREGAKLLPFMADLAKTGELVATTTTAQALQAEAYNDTVERSRMVVDQYKRQLALDLLPTLMSVHDITGDIGQAFTDHLAGGAKTAGLQIDILGAAIGGIGTTLETIAVLGANTGFVFKALGRDIGASAAAFVEMQKFNFTGAREILRMVKADDAAARVEVDAFTARVLGSTDRALQSRRALQGGGTTRADDARELGRMDEAAGRAANGQIKFSAATKEAAAAVDRHAEEVRKLFERLGLLSTEQQAALAQGEPITAAQKETIALMVRLRDGTLQLTDAEKVRLRQNLESINQQEQAIAQQKAQKALVEDQAKFSAQVAADVGAETQRLRDQTAGLRDQNLALALGADAYGELQAARLHARADELESLSNISQYNDELLAQAALLRDQAFLIKEKVDLSRAVTKPLGADTYTDVRDALARAFQDTKNPIRAFADGLGNAIFSRVTSRLADALATQLVGSSGSAGLFGDLLSGLGNFLSGGVPVGNGTGATGDFARFDRVARPLASGMDYVPYDGFRALLHKGERVTTAAENAEGRTSASRALHYAPQTTIHVDARADRSAVQQDVAQIVAESNKRQLDELHRLGVV